MESSELWVDPVQSQRDRIKKLQEQEQLKAAKFTDEPAGKTAAACLTALRSQLARGNNEDAEYSGFVE